ncbi:MAG: sodium-dependent bicarbonate transport family permease [Planctomycetes bacterium]|nr:sodium-dependent bicarbonate transport family permease [Planctomycetota bacterium]
MLLELFENFRHNLFKPLLMFFYLGFAATLFRVPLKYPPQLYQGLTIYLLVAIGWHGGEELAALPSTTLVQALGFMVIGFFSNMFIGVLAYQILRRTTRMRQIDQATVAGFYGSDSAGTFVTCIGALNTAGLVYAPYMPVLLAVMEIPGCLVALFLVSRLRQKGMDALGNMPGEPDYDPNAVPTPPGNHSAGTCDPAHTDSELEADLALERRGRAGAASGNITTLVARTTAKESVFNKELMREVFLNPGIFLLFGGIGIGFIGRLQGIHYTEKDDPFFVNMFQGALCLFLLEMGLTAAAKLRDLTTAGWQFILFGILAPNLFATIGMLVVHAYSFAIHQRFDIGTYALFAVLSAAASYIAVPAVQRLAIPEASPTLPLAASLGLTFTYNVTVGIPVYILIASVLTRQFAVA